jgi:hypothetical protein
MPAMRKCWITKNLIFMHTINNEKQARLINALKKVPKQKEVIIRDYLDYLLLILNDFRYKIEWNINRKNSYTFSINYIKTIKEGFIVLYMTVDGTMDIILFPEIITLNESVKMSCIKTVIESHKYIYLKAISLLQNSESLILFKIQNKIPIVEIEALALSKYILKEKSVTNLIGKIF